ncbi:Rossmann-like and DUF2520 domain-containing protein [Pseudonocardia yuanmonensis]|uniref:Rossmann-like and DUF2520 domain-containing protein n=1 Tax=Pseudonocardia yuanmonensis TaxID=1095914 RepID=UPI0031EEC016
MGLVGAGKVGLVLAGALQQAGHRVSAFWDPDEAAQGRAEQLFTPILRLTTASDLAVHAGLIIVAVPDDVLPDVVEALASGSEPWRDIVVLHVSGRHGSRVLQPLAELGAATGAMHPAMAFTGDVATEIERLQGARFAVTAGPECVGRVRELVRRMGGEPIEIAEADRGLYHAALAHGSNHIVTLVVQAAQMLEAAGVASPADVLGPPLQAALANALTRGAEGATGPVVRGDLGTVGIHLRALRDAAPAALPAYCAMSRAGADLAWSAGRLATDRYENLRDLLLERP